jgi:Ca2+-binding RTX toxin-like protein
VTITDTLQSSVTRILPSGVENLTLTGTGNINGTGNTSNNILIGNTANNILTGAAGKDTLTGGTGIDKFGYKTLTDSLLANYDLITDFNATTGNDLFLVTTARAGFTTGLTVSTLDATGIGTALTTTNFAANFAAQFTFTSGTTTRTFVAINDATAGFNASTDSIVEVTGLTGTLAIGNFVTA